MNSIASQRTLSLVIFVLAMGIGLAWVLRPVSIETSRVVNLGELAAADSHSGPVLPEPQVSQALKDRAVAQQATPQVVETPKDLVLHVVDPSGTPVTGLPLLLKWRELGGTVLWKNRFRRTSGWGERSGTSLNRHTRLDPGQAGLATWSRDRGGVHNLQSELEEGKLKGAWILGLEMPNTAHLDVTFGVADWPTEDQVIRLDTQTMARIAPINVMVLHADGEPAVGVPVALGAWSLDPGIGDNSNGLLSEDERVLTDAQGSARVDRRPWLRHNRRFSDGGPDRTVAYVSPVLPLASAIQVRAPKFASYALPLTINLPPVGRLDARITDHLGAPMDLEQAGRQWRYSLSWGEPNSKGPAPKGERLEQSIHANSVELGWCGLDVPVKLVVREDSGRYRAQTVQARGPKVRGEVKQLVVALGPPLLATTFQVIGQDGAPLAEHGIEFVTRKLDEVPRQWTSSQRSWWYRLTDAKGRFEVLLPEDERTAAYVLEIRAESPAGHAFGSKVLGLVPLEPEGEVFDGGRVQLGSSALPELPEFVAPVRPLLVSGFVLGEDGQPVAGAEVKALKPQGTTSYGSDRTEDDGSFSISSEQLEPFSLHVSGYGIELFASATFEPGSRGVVVTVPLTPPDEYSGRLFGSLAAVPETGGDDLEIRVYRKWRTYTAWPDTELRFEVRGIPGGLCDVAIACGALDLEVFWWDDVQVIAGEAATDPRLTEIDVSQLVSLKRLTFKASTGESLAKHLVQIFLPTYETRELSIGPMLEREIFFPADLEDAVFYIPGYKRLEVSLAGPELELVFELQ